MIPSTQEHGAGIALKRGLKGGTDCNSGGTNRKLTHGADGGGDDDCNQDGQWDDDGKLGHFYLNLGHRACSLYRLEGNRDNDVNTARRGLTFRRRSYKEYKSL